MALSASDNEAVLWLRLALNNPDIDHAQAGLRQIEQSIAGVEKHAGTSSQAVATAIAPAQAAAQAAATQNLKDLKRMETQANRTQSEWRRLQFASRSMGEVFTIIGAAAGAVFLGGFALASKYVAGVKASTATVREWRVQLDRVKTSQDRVGAAFADAFLPLLQKAADLADTVVTFVESNPQIIRAALNSAGVILALSAIGIAATKGFKIYADIGYTLATAKQVAAGAAMEAAAAQQLVAAQEMVVAANTMVTGIPAGAAGAAGIAAGGAGAIAGGAGALAVGTAAIAQGYRLNSAGRLISSVSGRYVTAAQGMEANVGMEGLGGLGGGGVLGFLKSLPLYFFGAMKDTFSEAEMAQMAENAKTYHPRQPGESMSDYLKKSWEDTGGWPGFFDKLMGKTRPYAGAVDVATGERVSAYGGLSTGAATTATMGYTDLFAKQNVQLYTDWQKQITDATTAYAKQRASVEKQYEKERTDTVTTYAKQRAEAEENYTLDVSRSWRDFIQSENESVQNYYNARLKAAKDYSEKLRRMEEDHQIEMRRDLEDHDLRQQSLLEARDGMAMIREDQAYELARQRKEEDFALEIGRISTETAAQLRENEARFAAERAQRRAAFLQQMADRAQDFKLQMARSKAEEAIRLKELEETHNEQVAEMAEAYREQLSTLEEAFRARLRLIDQAILGDYSAVQSTVVKMTSAFRAWLASAAASLTPTTVPPSRRRAGGGYVDFGQFTMGEQGREFVLNNRSTQLAERNIGGSLSQERILAAMGGSSGRGGGVYSDHRTIQFTGITEADRAAIRRDMYDVTQEVLVEAMRR